MKKLAHTILLTAIILFLLEFLPRPSGLNFNLSTIARTAAYIIGSAAAITGLYKVVVSAFYKADKHAFYQGAFCILLGMAIASFSVWPFVPAIVLIAWLDHKGQSII